jgi:hypothetical protein
VSLRYPESLVKKNWPEPTRWIRQSNARGFMVGKVVGFYWFFSSMMSVVTQWLILFPSECSSLLRQVWIWYPESFVGKNYARTHPSGASLVEMLCANKIAVLHAILGLISVRQRTCTCTFEVCENVYLHMWEMYVKFQNLLPMLCGLLGLSSIVETS